MTFSIIKNYPILEFDEILELNDSTLEGIYYVAKKIFDKVELESRILDIINGNLPHAGLKRLIPKTLAEGLVLMGEKDFVSRKGMNPIIKTVEGDLALWGLNINLQNNISHQFDTVLAIYELLKFIEILNQSGKTKYEIDNDIHKYFLINLSNKLYNINTSFIFNTISIWPIKQSCWLNIKLDESNKYCDYLKLLLNK